MSGIGNIMQGGQIGESPSGKPFLTSANNGLALSTLTPATVVLGQNVNQPLNPATLLSAREIPQGGFGFNVFGGGIAFGQSRGGVPVSGMNVLVDNQAAPNLFQAIVGIHGVYSVNPNGQMSLNNVNDGIGCISFIGQRYLGTALPGSSVKSTTWNNLWHPNAAIVNADMIDVEMSSKVILDNASGDNYTAMLFDPQYTQTVASTGQITGFQYKPFYPGGPLSQQHIAFDIQTGDILFNSDTSQALGRVGIQGVPTPSAYLEIGGSLAGDPGTASLKLDFSTQLVVPEFGAMEYIGTGGLLFTPGAVQLNILMGVSGAAAPALHATPVFTSYYGLNTNALGAPNSWTAVVIGGVTYKIPLYT
jgi:hypothetical protein